MKRIEIPVTKSFDKEVAHQLGVLMINPDGLPEGIEYHFEPGFKIIEAEEGKDGRIIVKRAELIEISLVPNKIYEGRPIPVAKNWSRKGNCPICFAGCGSAHKVGCLYKK
jgi:hypothetical protein